LEKLNEKLKASAGGHLSDPDKKGLLKHMGIDDVVNHELINLDEVKGLYDMHNQLGKISKEIIQKQYKQSGRPQPVYFNKPKEA
jgi:fructose 1,6-bisphosphatase